MSVIDSMPAAPAAGPPLWPGLSQEQFRQVHDARRRAGKVRRGIAVATFNGWATGIFGVLTFFGGLLHWPGFLLGGAMAAVAWVEFAGARRLRGLDASAPRMLAWNQVALGAVLLLYAGFSLWRVMYHPSDLAAALPAMESLPGMTIELRDLERLIGLLVYGTLAAVAVFGQGACALFYLSRRKHVEAYVRDTPPWILDAQRAGMPM